MLVPQCASQRSWQPADVADLVEVGCHRYSVDRDRIYLVGYSMGGYGTWAAAAEHPELFAAIVPIAGGGNTKNDSVLSGIPLWAFHGAKDNVVPVGKSTALVEAIRARGGKAKLTVIPEAGHDIARQVCERADLWQWVFEQKLSNCLPGHSLEGVPT